MREISQAGVLFTWIKYADNINGDGISDSSEGKPYIGIAYNKNTPIASNNPKEYTWSLFKGENGRSLINTEIWYAISKNGITPPIDSSKIAVREDGILIFMEDDINFIVTQNETLAAQDINQNIFDLSAADNQISGVNSIWTKEIPEVPKGHYLWTKTIFYYSQGEPTIQFLSSYQGQDGEQGKDADKYKIKLNQTEILKFISNKAGETVKVSPSKLVVDILEVGADGHTTEIQSNQLNILDFRAAIYNIKTNMEHNIGIGSQYEEEKEIISLVDNSFEVNLSLLLEYGIKEKNEAANIFLNDECILIIQYTHTDINNNKHYLSEFINVRYGMNRDMASLSLEANGIVAAMQDSKMVFDATGLTIQNGAFRIEKTEQDGTKTQLLYADNDGDLVIAGKLEAASGTFRGKLEAASGSFSGELIAATGRFKGELEAASGSFSGEISASSGTIGGFNISGERLTSTEKDNNSGTPWLILDGKKGIIEAENIYLGTGAKIKEYIELGNSVRILNPDLENNYNKSFISVNNTSGLNLLSINADGTMLIGDNTDAIIINGAEGYIMSQNYQDGIGWKIANDWSVFNNVTVRGSIRASVLEYGEIQAIGGALLVRPSSRILSAKIKEGNTVLTLENAKGFLIGDKCRIDFGLNENGVLHNFYEVIAVEQLTAEQLKEGRQPQKVTLQGEITENITGKPILNLGKKGSVGLGLNGSIDDTFVPPSALTVFEFDGKDKINHRIILGKLPNQKEIYGFAAGTYGLYAENVKLQGSLVTQTKTEDGMPAIYSGINTLYDDQNSPNSKNSKAAAYFKEPGEILLWAGAKSEEKIDIENSNFFVDRNGNLYANSGYFKGTIITDATITASSLETATLRGIGSSPALTIEDAQNGIHFTSFEENLLDSDFNKWKESEFNLEPILITKDYYSVIPGSRYFLSFGNKIDNIIVYYYNDSNVEQSIEIKDKITDFESLLIPKNSTKIKIGIQKYSGIKEIESEFGTNIVPILKKYITVFEVKKDSIIANVKEFSFNNNFKIKEDGALVIPSLYIVGNNIEKPALIVEENKISYSSTFIEEKWNGTIQSYIDFQSGLTLSTGTSTLKISETDLLINNPLLLDDEVRYKEKVKYKPAYSNNILVGYDLYVE